MFGYIYYNSVNNKQTSSKKKLLIGIQFPEYYCNKLKELSIICKK
jgi:hypothetical protein